LCHVTSHVQADPHQTLLEAKGGTGFPHLAFLDAEGEVVAVHQGARTVAAFEETRNRATAFLGLKKKAEAGDAAAKKEFLIAGVELGRMTLEDVDVKLKALGALTPDQASRLDAVRVNAEVLSMLQKTQRSRDSQLATGKAFLEMKKAGRPAPCGDQESILYWLLMMGYAEDVEDVATLEEGLRNLRPKIAEDPQAKAFIEGREAVIKRLKEGAK
jgi:hypothetical protein